ncbi:MAG: hypothetical protein QXG97_03440 [Nitrososphaerota archaeon]
MFDVDKIGARAKDLEKQRDRLVQELKKLEEDRKKGAIDEETYKEKRHEIERAIVETMDRLAQMQFMMGKE